MRLAGLDGCPAGWVAARADAAFAAVTIEIAPTVAALFDRPDPPQTLAIDMPIGLPDRVGPRGRAPERLVRPRLGARQSSVFAVPSRAAIYADDFRAACAAARATSDPPRAASIQLWGIAPKIRELDGLLRARPDLVARVFEVHPEVAFWRMNGERALDLPKKVRGRPHEPGLALRAELLRAGGLDPAAHATPRGAGPDDVLDALACLWVARRIARGEAVPVPDPPEHDAVGLPIAIWA